MPENKQSELPSGTGGRRTTGFELKSLPCLVFLQLNQNVRLC